MFFSFPWRRSSLRSARRSHCPLCSGDLLGQANQLVAAGYYVAAVATARCELEARVRAASFAVHTDGDGFRGSWSTGQLAKFLNNRNVLTRKETLRIGKLLRRAAHVLHSYHDGNCLRARWIIAEVDSIVAAIQKGIEQSRPVYTRKFAVQPVCQRQGE